jgi:hypothetical protein
MSSVESLRSSSPSGAKRFVSFVAFCVEDNWATRPLDVTHSVQASPCFCEVAFIRVHSRLTPPLVTSAAAEVFPIAAKARADRLS